jgi:signal transduction histidine kinase
LSDYARLAAWELKTRLEFRFAVYTCGAIARSTTVLDRLETDEPLPTPDALAALMPPSQRPAFDHLREIHVFEFAPDRFRGVPPENADALAALVRRETAQGTDEERGWFYSHAEGTGRLVCGVRDDEGRPVHAWIFLLDGEGIRDTITKIAAVAPLLPEFLERGSDSTDWLGWRLLTPSGEDVASADPGMDSAARRTADDWTAEESTAPFLGELVVRVRILPVAAGLLVPGGVPRSNLALTLALVVLSGALLWGADRQVRRESRLATLREDFLAGISHELRTPLAQIRMFAETLRLGRVRNREESDRSLDVVIRESQRLSHLVENILVDSRSMRGVLGASLVRTDISRRLAEAVDELTPLAEAGGSHVRKRIEPGLIGAVDPELLHQVLVNLLDNAVKFGPRGQTVTVGATRADTDLRIWVEDQGPGIPAADRAHVGRRFFRLERDRAGAIAGTGIGLSVVTEVARLHGGSLDVEDADGRGARLVLRLPLTGDLE